MDILDFAPLVRKYTWNKSEDMQAEAWLAVVEAFDKFDSAKGIPLPGYVESCVKFKVWNAVKREQRHYQHELYFTDKESGKNLIEILPDNINVSKIVERRLLKQELRKNLSKLTPKQNFVVVGTIFEGYSLKEVGKKMGITPQAVFNLRKRGLERLKKCTERIYTSENRHAGNTL